MPESLTGITAETVRKSAFTAAVAAAPIPAEETAAAQTAIQEHYSRALKAWAAQTGTAATERDFKMRESLIDSSVLTTWTTELTTAGYVVSNSSSPPSTDGFCTVSLSA